MRNLLAFFILSCFSCMTYALNDNLVDEALLDTAKASATTLLATCVNVPPLNAEQLAACTATKVAYITDLSLLVKPAKLEVSYEIDPYAWNVFTPCHYEVAFLIIPDMCITKPSLT